MKYSFYYENHGEVSSFGVRAEKEHPHEVIPWAVKQAMENHGDLFSVLTDEQKDRMLIDLTTEYLSCEDPKRKELCEMVIGFMMDDKEEGGE